MRAAIAIGVLTASLAVSGNADAEHPGGGVWFGFGYSRVDYHHDHYLDCGCRVSCDYYGGAHHYSHRHRHGRHGRYDGRYDGRYHRGYGNDYDSRSYRRYGDGYYDGSYGDYYGRDRYYRHSEYRTQYWHDHFVDGRRFLRCHVVRGVHHLRRW